MPQPTIFHERLSGYTAIITGAGSMGDGVGTGKATALLFASEGAKVVLVDINQDRADETASAIRKTGGEAKVVLADVTSEGDCAMVVKETIDWTGSLDILVNNVGLGASRGRLETLKVEDWAKGVALNLESAFLMSRSAMPYLLKGQAKAIVNIASVAGLLAHGTAAYGPAKAAMIQLTREIAVMYGAEGIRANAVAPGHIMTPLVEQFSSTDARRLRRQIAPLNIEGDAWDVAQAALFLAGRESRFITGVCLPVDGGVTQTGPLAAYGLASGEGGLG